MKLSFITRYSIMFFSVIIILTSCRKELAPVPNSSNTSTTKNDDKPMLLTEDEVMHSVSLNIGTQYVKTAVNSNVLTLTYEEDASTVLVYKGYDLSFSI